MQMNVYYRRSYNGMLEQENEARLSAKVKAQIIKQIFKDLGPKNLKGVEVFYLIISEEQVQLQFISLAKDILITIILKKNLFHHFAYTRQRPSLHKYSLQDFTLIAYLFENNKILLDLELTPLRFTLAYTSPNGRTEFCAQALSCDPDDQELLIADKDLRPQQGSLQMRLGRAGMLEGVLSYAKGCKLSSLWFRYQSCRKMLQVSDRRQRPQISWLLKVQQQPRVTLAVEMELNCKMLACALNLLPNDSQLILTFYPGFLLLDVPQKQKTFTIRLNAKHQPNE